MLAIKDNIPSKLLMSPPELEAVTVQILSKFSFILCLVYLPPNSLVNVFDTLSTHVTNLCHKNLPIIILGDFNTPDINWDTLTGSSSQSNLFCDLVFHLNLLQLVDKPTHVQGNTLDLIFTNKEDLIDNVTVQPQEAFCVSSDHFMVSFNLCLPSYSSINIPHYVFDYGKYKFEELNDYLHNSNINQCLYYSDVEVVWSIIKDILAHAMSIFVPKFRLKNRQYPSWFTPTIRHKLNCLHTLRKKAKKSPTTHNLNRLAIAEQDFKDYVDRSKTSYENKLVHSFANHSNYKIYQYIRNISKSKSIPSTVFYDDVSATCDKARADIFSEYFYSVFTSSSCSLPEIWEFPPHTNSLHSIYIDDCEVYSALVNLDVNKATGMDNVGPKFLKHCAISFFQPIHHLFNLTLSNSVIPDDWKVHQIVPVFKSGDRSLVQNYRPISLLCNVSKVLEYIINDKIVSFVTSSISHKQFGFLRGKSTVQQLLLFLNYIYHSISDGCQHDVIYLDFRKAFDSVPHNNLLCKLWSFGITGKLWQWFRSYLKDHHQRVKINSSNSDLLPVQSGVPQGSILGPLLFLIYINDLPLCTQFSTVFMFADDAKCSSHITSPENCHLQRDLDNMSNWSTSNHLHFNMSKCTLLSFNSQLNSNYQIDGNALSLIDHHRDLGVIFSSDLSWNKHYEHIITKAYRSLGLLRRTFSNSSSTSAKKLLYTSLVRSQLTYGSQIWHPHLLKDIIVLEQVQRRSTCFILNDYKSNYKSRLLKLNLLPLMYLLDYYDIMFFVTSLKNPSTHFNILDYVKFSSFNTRSSTTNKLCYTFSPNNTSRHFYFTRLPTTWNSLPVINLNLSIANIKSQIKAALWNHFLCNFDSENPCSFHFSCPCRNCHNNALRQNFQEL